MVNVPISLRRAAVSYLKPRGGDNRPSERKETINTYVTRHFLQLVSTFQFHVDWSMASGDGPWSLVGATLSHKRVAKMSSLLVPSSLLVSVYHPPLCWCLSTTFLSVGVCLPPLSTAFLSVGVCLPPSSLCLPPSSLLVSVVSVYRPPLCWCLSTALLSVGVCLPPSSLLVSVYRPPLCWCLSTAFLSVGVCSVCLPPSSLLVSVYRLPLCWCL